MTKLKKTYRIATTFVNIIVIALFLSITVICVYTFGWTKKTVSNLNRSDQLQIISEYGLELHNDEYIDCIMFLSYGFEKYYVIKVDNIDDVSAWATQNPSWVIEDFDSQLMIFDNKRYANQRIYRSDKCIYVSILSENQSGLSQIFNRLYG